MLVKGKIKWHAEAEVVMVGYGGAGATAAITARDRGTDVLLLEKQKQGNHYTNTGMAGGSFMSPSSAAEAAKYLRNLYRINETMSWTDDKVIDAWAAYASENKEWLEKTTGTTLTVARTVENVAMSYPFFPGRESLIGFRFRGLGWGLMNALEKQVTDRKIPVIYGASANKLLTDNSGRVIGVSAEIDEGGQKKVVNVAASKAVILTCGGFQFSEALKRQYLPVYPFYSHGTPACTGEGVTMALDVGAQLWHMNCFAGRLMAKFDDFPIAFSLEFRGDRRPLKQRFGTAEAKEEPSGFIFVDRHGKRYTSEDFIGHYLCYELSVWDSHRLEYPRVPSYAIFDQKRIGKGPLADRRKGASGPCRLYQWSEDNHVEIEKGWITVGDSLPELARKISVDPDNLVKTVNNYNSYCTHGADPEFGTKASSLVPVRDAPYYAVKLWPGGCCAHGGPRRNSKSQVLNVDNESIPGLYVAGELGSIYAMPSLDAAFLAEMFAFGRIAGENAAAEKAVGIG